MGLRRLVYGSSTPTLLTPSVVADILYVSRRNNLADEVTGVLLYADGNVLQVLEGDAETVSRTFDRIQDDPRHRHIALFLDEAIDERMFAEWAMGLIRADKLSVDQFTEVQTLHEVEIPAEGTVRHLLLAFREMCGR